MTGEPTFMLDVLACWAERMFSACWQGGLILLLVWCLCRAWRTCPPNVRCWLWRIAYLKLVALLLFGGLIRIPLLPPAKLPVDTLTAATTAPRPPPTPVLPHARAPSPQISLPADRYPDPRAATLPKLFLVCGFAAWLVGMVWRLAGIVRDGCAVQQMRMASQATVDPRTISLRDALCRLFRLNQIPRIATADGCESPLLVGVFRPLILVPSALTQSSRFDELRLVLAHEIAHVKRQDLLWNWLPVFVRTAFFFHPLVWLAERRWALAQELACDELTLSVTGAPVGSYGKLLVNVSQRCKCQPQPVFATLGVASSFETLTTRISAMNQIGNRSAVSLAATSLGVVVLGLLALVPFQLVAQEASSESSATDSTEVTVNEPPSHGSTMISVVNDDGTQSITIKWHEDGANVTYQRTTEQGKKETRSYELTDMEELRSQYKQAYDFYKQHTVTSQNKAGNATVYAYGVGENSVTTKASVATAGRGRSTASAATSASVGIASSSHGSGSQTASASNRPSVHGSGVAVASESNSVDDLIAQIKRTIRTTDDPRIKRALQRSIDELKKANR